ncbi:methyl-accepting chemotaxis protein [Thermosulfurimonas sp. F29]|uniref:methyl-accepting chemotaxis protein n=1 Tax=Thermosulfurimonas sp. F29 TaxID=2867247 RepID=UPI001C82DFC0|nr:methyl-accepting chemotaxis protein [Thermosulfurimonas sp. F29]MBX6422052.1 methyl-accepting chemotaxis protein [Thermosulfurimonas sp. F29]
MERERRRRLNLRIKRDLQVWILKRTVFSMVAGMIIGFIILYFFSHRELGETYWQAHITIKRVSDLLVPVMVAAGLAGFLGSLVLLVFFPQKIAGPIYRLERDFCNHLKEGDLTFRFSLRRDDPFQTLPQAINEAVGTLRERVREVARRADAARRALEEGRSEEALRELRGLEEFMRTHLKF